MCGRVCRALPMTAVRTQVGCEYARRVRLMYRGLWQMILRFDKGADVPEEVLQRCIKTSKACHSFQVVRGGGFEVVCLL